MPSIFDVWKIFQGIRGKVFWSRFGGIVGVEAMKEEGAGL